MLAAWYERPGPAAEVLEVGAIADLAPGPREVRVCVTVSGINPGDTKKRNDWVGFGMPYPRLVPHSDGTGAIDAINEGVDRARIGERVWTFGAQSYRAFDAAAQLSVVPASRRCGCLRRSVSRSGPALVSRV
jgi:NADPH:quinone reductase